MNILKGLFKAEELKKNQTLNIISPAPLLKNHLSVETEINSGTISKTDVSGTKGRDFNINLDSVHIDKSKKPSLLSRFSKPKDKPLTSLNPEQKPRGSVWLNSVVLKGPNHKMGYLNNNQKGIKGSKSGLVEKRESIHGYIRNNADIHRLFKVSPGLKNGLLLNYEKFISYQFNSSQSKLTKKLLPDSSRGGIKETYELLYYFFKTMYCLISKPVFIESSSKIIIQLFYYLSIPKKKVFKLFSYQYKEEFKNKWLKKRQSQAVSMRKWANKFRYNRRINVNYTPKIFIKWRIRKAISRLRSKSTKIRDLLFDLRKYNITKVFYRKFELICQILSKKFNKAVELQLIRLHNPNHDSNILINLISLNIRNKRKNARKAINKIYAKNQIKIINDPSLNSINFIPSYLSGINIKIAGRLMREPIIPKITTKKFERGATATGKVNYLDVATITKKNRKGAYTITIKSGQNFFASPKK